MKSELGIDQHFLKFESDGLRTIRNSTYECPLYSKTCRCQNSALIKNNHEWEIKKTKIPKRKSHDSFAHIHNRTNHTQWNITKSLPEHLSRKPNLFNIKHQKKRNTKKCNQFKEQSHLTKTITTHSIHPMATVLIVMCRGKNEEKTKRKKNEKKSAVI